MTNRTGSRDLEAWLAAMEAHDDQPDLRSLATCIGTDQRAVTNGLALPYSSGKVEGTVNKIKMTNDRCTAAPPSNCSVNASSCTLRNRDHKIRGRAESYGRCLNWTRG